MLMLVVTMFSDTVVINCNASSSEAWAYLPASVLSTVRMRRVRPESPSPPTLRMRM